MIDDCSSDNTLNLLKSNNHLYKKLVVMERNSGKGAAVKKGLIAATGEYILFQDADLEYDPNDLKWALDQGITIISTDEFYELGINKTISKIKNI